MSAKFRVKGTLSTRKLKLNTDLQDLNRIFEKVRVQLFLHGQKMRGKNDEGQ